MTTWDWLWDWAHTTGHGVSIRNCWSLTTSWALTSWFPLDWRSWRHIVQQTYLCLPRPNLLRPLRNKWIVWWVRKYHMQIDLLAIIYVNHWDWEWPTFCQCSAIPTNKHGGFNSSCCVLLREWGCYKDHLSYHMKMEKWNVEMWSHIVLIYRYNWILDYSPWFPIRSKPRLVPLLVLDKTNWFITT